MIENSCQYSHINYDNYESAHEAILDDLEPADGQESNRQEERSNSDD